MLLRECYTLDLLLHSAEHAAADHLKMCDGLTWKTCLMQNMQLEGVAARSATSEPMQAGGLRENHRRSGNDTVQGRLVSSHQEQPLSPVQVESQGHRLPLGAIVLNSCLPLHEASVEALTEANPFLVVLQIHEVHQAVYPAARPQGHNLLTTQDALSRLDILSKHISELTDRPACSRCSVATADSRETCEVSWFAGLRSAAMLQLWFRGD